MTVTLDAELKEQLKRFTDEARKNLIGFSEDKLLAEGIEAHEELIDAYNESINSFSFVDPLERYIDPGDSSTLWTPVNGFKRTDRSPTASGLADPRLDSDFDYDRMRHNSRLLALRNEYAINIIENMINFVIGNGLKYLAVTNPRVGDKAKSSEAQQRRLEVAQDVIDDFIEDNDWDELEQELEKRGLRDGEFFLRLFRKLDGSTTVRTIEPEQVFTPQDQQHNENVSFGILFDSDDRQEPLGYYVDGDFVSADQIIHKKFNVDRSIARGVSAFYAVEENLRRAEKLMRNMSRVAAVQATLIGSRSFENSSKAAVERMIKSKSAFSHVDRLRQAVPGSNPQNKEVMNYSLPTMINMPRGQKFEFFTKAIAAESFIPVLRQELIGIAARFNFTEYMLTSDASNGNFASTMVAETPFVRSMERRQGLATKLGTRVMWLVLINSGVMSRSTRKSVKVNAEAPNLIIRDNRKEAQANMIKAEAGIISPQTWSQKEGLDYKSEQNNRVEHEAKFGSFPANSKQNDAAEQETNDERRDRETDGEDEGR